jgi:hypothetical protein
MKRSLVRSTILATGFVLSSLGTVAFADTFGVNPGAIGVIAPTVSNINYADYSYVALVNQTATNGTGTFNEQGAGFFSSYRFPTLSDVLPNTGLNTNYKMYAVFTGSGTVAPTAGVPGGETATFTAFNLQMYVDPTLNTTIVASPVGTPGGTVSLTGNGDDILVGQSSALLAGQAHVFPGLANGDFKVLVNFQPVGGFLSGPFSLALTIGTFDGNLTSLQGFSLNSFTSGRIDGSGNLSFTAVPEPTSLLLLGSGLAALGWARRRTRA